MGPGAIHCVLSIVKGRPGIRTVASAVHVSEVREGAVVCADAGLTRTARLKTMNAYFITGLAWKRRTRATPDVASGLCDELELLLLNGV
jgi:hypothetical protein